VPRSRSSIRLSVAFAVTEPYLLTMAPSSLLVLSLLIPFTSARILRLPVDTYAFPKYKVSFLNALPLWNDTAQRWLDDGLRGGEQEFMEQPWGGDDRAAMEIGSGDDQAHVSAHRPHLR